VLERVQQALGARETGGAQGLRRLEGLTAAREEVDPACVLTAQRVALPGRAVHELEQINGRGLRLARVLSG
jgi:hypothetical protein